MLNEITRYAIAIVLIVAILKLITARKVGK